MFEHSDDDRIRGLDETTAAFALLSAHEFILEVLLANVFAGMPKAAADQAASELNDRSARGYGAALTADPAAIEQLQRSGQASRAFVERLVAKAQSRSGDLRKNRDAPG